MRLGLCTAVVNHVGEGEGAALLHERVCALDSRQDWLEEAAEGRSTLLLSICWRIFCQVGFRVLRRSALLPSLSWQSFGLSVQGELAGLSLWLKALLSQTLHPSTQTPNTKPLD